MAYTPKTWQCDDTITADELNRIEQGIAEASQGGGGTEPLIVTVTSREATTEECATGGTVAEFSHSWQEMYDAFMAGRAVILDTTELLGTAPAQTFSAVTEFFADSRGTAIFYLGSTRVESIQFGSPTGKTVVKCSIL